MRRTTFWLLTALFTFTVGVIAYFLWVPHNYSNEVTSVQTGEVDLRWVYINKDLHWEHPPKEVGLDYSYSGINILVLYPNGLFASNTGTVYQIEKPSRIMLVPNEGFGVYKGTWKRNGDGTITVISRLTASNKLRDDPDGKLHAERVERLIIRKAVDNRLADELELNGEIFIPSSNIEGIGDLLSFPDGDI